jgi:hypothetical protein
MRSRLWMAAILACLAGCGGGHGSALMPGTTTNGTSGSANSSSKAKATLTITIPNAASLPASKRQIAYVSAASNTIDVTATFGATVFTNNNIDVSGSSPYCVPAANGRTCNVPIEAPIGASVQFELQIFNGSGQVLSTSSFATPVTAAIAGQGVNVLPPVVLNGVPSSFSVSVGAIPYNVVNYSASASSAPAQVIVTAKDASGDIIAGPGNYSTSDGLTAISYSIGQYVAVEIPSVNFSTNSTCSSQTASATWSAPSNTVYACNTGSSNIGTQFLVTQSNTGASQTIPVPFVDISISEVQLSHNDYMQIPIFYGGSGPSSATAEYGTDNVGGIGPGYAFAGTANSTSPVGCQLTGAQTPPAFVVYGANGNFYVIGAGGTPSIYKFAESTMTSGGGNNCASTTSLATLSTSPSAVAEDPVHHRLWVAEGTTIQIFDETANFTTTNPLLTTLSSSISTVNALAFTAAESAMYASTYQNSAIQRFSTSSDSSTNTETLDAGSPGDVVAAGPDGAVYAMTQLAAPTIYRLNPNYTYSASPPVVAAYPSGAQFDDVFQAGMFAVGGDGQIWVLEGLTPTIDRVDPTSGNVFVSAAPVTGTISQIFAASGNGVNRIGWLEGGFQVYLWPGLWPAD